MKKIFYLFFSLLFIHGEVSAQNDEKNVLAGCPMPTPLVQVIPIDSVEFFQHAIKPQRIESTSIYKKKRKRIKIQSISKTFCFKDDLREKFYHEYFVIGTIMNNVIVKYQDYNDEVFYMINPSTNSIDTLIGYPQVYRDKILCVEGSKADGGNTIEVWKISPKKSTLLLKARLIEQKVYHIDQIYLFNNDIYIRSDDVGSDTRNKYFRLSPNFSTLDSLHQPYKYGGKESNCTATQPVALVLVKERDRCFVDDFLDKDGNSEKAQMKEYLKTEQTQSRPDGHLNIVNPLPR